MVGLSSAWFLQEAGVEVEVVDRQGVAAGSSWGNAGWLSPALTVPLPEPGLLKEGPRIVMGRAAPVVIPRTWDPQLWAFLARMARHCTSRQWQRAMRAYRGVNDEALAAYDHLEQHGVQAESIERRILAAVATRGEAQPFVDELLRVSAAGQHVDMEVLTGDEARAEEPLLSDAIMMAVAVKGSRYINPGDYVRAIGDAVVAGGGTVRAGVQVQGVAHRGTRVVIEAADEQIEADAVVLANGAWLSSLAGPHGVSTQVRAGRGYSFTVDTPTPPAGPIYLPGALSACTPYRGALRVTGMMELDDVDAPLAPRRIETIARAIEPFYRGIDVQARRDEWVGARPVTPDGLPLIGATRTPGVYVAGGHGMWGVTLGPLTGQLLAPLITEGRKAPALEAFDPVR